MDSVASSFYTKGFKALTLTSLLFTLIGGALIKTRGGVNQFQKADTAALFEEAARATLKAGHDHSDMLKAVRADQMLFVPDFSTLGLMRLELSPQKP